MKIDLCAETAKSCSHKGTKGVKSYELRTKSGGTATTCAFCLNCDLCDFNDLYDSDCRNDYSRTIVVDSKSPERATSIAHGQRRQRPVNTSQATSIAHGQRRQRPVNTSRAASSRRTHDNQNHKNHTIHKTSIADIIFSPKLRLFVLLCVLSTPLSAQFFYEESCRNATGIFQYYGDAPGYTAGLGIDAPGDGWLRLTNTEQSKGGYVLLDATFPSSMGVSMEFDFKIWADDLSGSSTGKISDGLCVFLFDGDADSTFTIGGFGGGLGYLNLKPAYLGVGIDEYGNFSRAYLGFLDGPGRRPQSIAIRDAAYRYVDGTTDSLGNSTLLEYTPVTPTRPDDATIYRRAKIEMEPIPGGMSVTVSLKTTPTGNYDPIIGPISVLQDTPPLLRLGFSASTGGSWAYHEVRDVIIRTPGELAVFKSTNECNATQDNVVINTIVANNTNAAVNNISISDTLPADFVITGGSPAVTNGTMSGFTLANIMGDGRKVYSYTVNVPGNSNATITYNGSFATLPSSGQYVSSVKMTPPTGFNDANLNDNQAVNTSYFNLLSAAYTTIPLTSAPVTLTVTATNSASVTSYTWEQSLDNGANWTPLASTVTASYIYTGTANALVRCTALWDTWCRDMVVFRCVPAPDNVSDADCYVTPSSMTWGMTQDFISTQTNIATYIAPVSGDLDGDGIPEILVARFLSDDESDYRLYNGIYIYWGDNRQTPSLVNVVNGNFESAGFSIAKVKIANVYSPVIVTQGYPDGFLYAYDPDPTKTTETASRIWKSSHTLNTGLRFSNSIGFVDFDGDGKVEVYAGNQIFDAETGTMLVDGGTATNKGYSRQFTGYYYNYSYAADVTGDGLPEFLAGTKAYSVTINSSTDYTKNSLTLIASVPNIPITGSLYLNDGATAVADINMDGRVDVIVAAALNSTTYGFAAWDVQTETVIAKGYEATTAGNFSVPFIGNIDNDPNLEILIVSTNKIRGFRWNGSGTQTFSTIYDYTVVDASGGTGITLFDFNHDNIMELVYRDESKLRILQANAPSFTDKETFNAASGTSVEHAIVVDVDNDGQAEIITTGGSSASAVAVQGTLRIFGAGTGTNWAPARKVWNQYMYNAVNVNEDLTIPAFQFNPATRFPGNDNTVGTADDVQPYNNFLQQQTVLNQDGVPFWLAPDATFSGDPVLNYYVDGDSLVVTVQVKNAGDAALQTPFYISAFKNTKTAANKITADSCMTVINPGETKPVTVTVRNLSTYTFNRIIIGLNTKDGVAYAQAECDEDNNEKEYDEDDLLIARNDRVSTATNIHVIIPVLANDSIPGNCTPALEVIRQSAGSTATLTAGGDSIRYTPAPGFTGYDTLVYRLACGTDASSTAHIYVYVAEIPDNVVSDADCYITPPSMAWSIREVSISSATDYNCGQSPLIGDIDGDGAVEIIVTRGDAPNTNIYVLNSDGSVKRNFSTAISSQNESAVTAMGRVKWNAVKDTTLILTMQVGSGSSSNRHLKAYDAKTGNLLWTTSQYFHSETNAIGAAATIVDLDGDGWAEVCVGNKVYAAESGILLCAADPSLSKGKAIWTATSQGLIHSFPARVMNTSKQQLCAGNTVYDITITNRSGIAGNTILAAVTLPSVIMPDGSSPETPDGATYVADLDLDGALDVIVASPPVSSTNLCIYAWSPLKNAVIASRVIPDARKKSELLIGDIDGDGYPEIVVMHGKEYGNDNNASTNKITAMKFDPSSPSKELKQLWQKYHDDTSGATGITLFDFNQDGIMELVYRDEDWLCIINGSLKSHITGNDTTQVYNMASVSCNSATWYEYPVIADIDGDSQAEIITVGKSGTYDIPNSFTGPVRIFKAGVNSKWAPARKVWNQYAYNATNVNEDLTIPRYPLNPATVFPGKDKVSGTADDVRPYNSFLQQQTTLNQDGVPFWLAPDAEFSGDPVFNYYAGGDSLVIAVQVKNAGDAALQAPFYVSVFKDAKSSANRIATDSCMTVINPGETKPVTVTVRNLSTYTFDRIIIGLNTKDGSTYIQTECDEDNNEKEYNEDDLLRAHNDRATTFGVSPVRIDVLTNDSIPTGCASTISPEIVTTTTKHGTASNVNDSIQYVANTGFAGYDTVVYKLVCGNDTSAAKVIVRVNEFPDNVSEEDCYVTPPPMKWGITTDWSSEDSVSYRNTPFVGDLDDDGIPEIMCFGYDKNSTHLVTVVVFDGSSKVLKTKFTLPSPVTGWDASAYGLVKLPDRTGLIVFASEDLKLRAYDITTNPGTGHLVWTSDYDYSTDSKDFAVNVGFADFNHDGLPELYVRDKIYDASTGKLLNAATGGSNTGSAWAHGSHSSGRKLSSPIAADVIGDDRPELILGNEIYNVAISPDRSKLGIDRTVNSITLAPGVAGRITPPAGVAEDGHAQVVDFNMDGRPDIFISNRDVAANAGAVVSGYVWDVYNNRVSSSFDITCNYSGKSIPLIADVDNDGKLEIVIQSGVSGSNGKIRCYKYDPVAMTFSFLWDIAPDEDSFSNSMTLFDFNQDGMNELLITDQQKVRIFNGSGKSHITRNDTVSVYEMAALDFTEITIMQYPVIADVDGDGHAEIVACGMDDKSKPILNIFKSEYPDNLWAPARKVWNQYMYHSVNVNEDLTVPRYQMSPATAFPGKDNIIGTADDVRPYNNFLQQQTVLSQDGVPFWLTPDAKFAGVSGFSYYGHGDSLVISTKLTNIGDAALNATFHVSAYKTSVAAANRMSTDSSMVALSVGDTRTLTLTIRKFSTHTPLNKIILRINDKGSAAYIQLECDYDNNVFEFNPARLPKAANDTVAMLTDTTVTTGVKFNDALPSICSPSVTPAVVVAPAFAGSVAAIVNDSIKYTPARGFYGVDSLVYSLTCISNDTTYYTEAKVYITVNKPKSATYIACKGKKTTAGFEAITNVTYYWYNTETGGSPDGLAMNTRDCEAPGVWWVEARYKDKPVRPRLKVTIDEYPELDLNGFSIGNAQTVCHGNVPAQLKSSGSPSGGDGNYEYQWQQSSNGVNGWTDVKDSTNTTLTPPALTSDTYYRLKVTSCSTDSSNVVKITVRPQSLYNYPDLRISVCPDAGASINLSKYIDTLDVSSLSWENVAPYIQLSNTATGTVSTGTISTADLNASTRVYTLAYTVSNPCASNVKRRVYLETVKNGKLRSLRDSIAICYEYAEAVQVNQIFGIDARGTWSFEAFEADGVTSTTVNPSYLKESESPEYKGAVIMNGKAIYETTTARKIVITYTPANDSCLAGKPPIKVKIVLTGS